MPDELISSTELGLTNGGDINQLQTSLGLAQDAASKHKQLSELLRAGSSPNLNMGVGGPGQGMASQTQQNSPGMGMLNSMVKSPMAQAGLTSPNMAMGAGGPNQGPSAQSTAAMMPTVNSPVNQPGMGMNTGMNAGMNPGMLAAGNGQGMMQGQVMNGSIGAGRGRPNMPYPNPGMGTGNLLAETLQQGTPQMGGQAALRGPQPGAMNKVRQAKLHYFSSLLTLFCKINPLNSGFYRIFSLRILYDGLNSLYAAKVEYVIVIGSKNGILHNKAYFGNLVTVQIIHYTEK